MTKKRTIVISDSDREADWIKHVGKGRESELKVFDDLKKEGWTRG